MRLYFDTSAVVPLYVPEAASPRASERLRDATTLFVSWLTEVEFRSALALKTRAKGPGARSGEASTKNLPTPHRPKGLRTPLRGSGGLCSSGRVARAVRHAPSIPRRPSPRVLPAGRVRSGHPRRRPFPCGSASRRAVRFPRGRVSRSRHAWTFLRFQDGPADLLRKGLRSRVVPEE